MGETATQVAIGAATGGLGLIVYNDYQQQREQRRQMRTLMDQQKDERIAAEAQLKKRQDDEASRRASLSLSLALRNRARDSSVANRGGTILTGPLGSPGSNATGAKTLLGS